MNKKEEVLAELSKHRNQYRSIYLKGVFVRFGDAYYPVKGVFLPVREEKQRNQSRQFDYGDMVFLENWFDIDSLERVLKDVGEESQFQIGNHEIKIPKGYFRSLDDGSNQQELSKMYGFYSPLGEHERKVITECRSFPLSTFRQWPSKAYLFQFREGNIGGFFSSKLYERTALKENCPVFPTYNDALLWWLGGDNDRIGSGTLILLIPDFRVRIKNVRFAKNNFVIHIEERDMDLARLRGKYYILYDDFTQEVGDISSLRSKETNISVRRSVQQFYFVLYDIENPEIGIDYRKFDWRRPSEDLDIEIEVSEESVEYWLSLGENETLEYKLRIDSDDPKEFLETACSFSNTSGGRILIGVDNNANVRGIGDVDRCMKKAGDLIIEWIEPKVRFKISPVLHQEKQLISVSVSKGSDSPYNYRKHGVYVRTGSTDRIASREELLTLVPQKKIAIRR